MNKTPLAALLIVATATLVAAAQTRPANPAAPPDVLLKAAANRELIDGDVERAIAAYQDIASRYRTTHPAIAAEALVRLARSYERIDSPDAKSIYRTLVNEFVDTREAATARLRLAALDATPGVIAQSGSPVPVRLLQSDSLVTLNSVSADGRVAIGVAWSWSADAASVVESLVSVDLTTGAQTVLVPGAVGAQIFGGELSPDESRVAYAWRDSAGSGRQSSLRVVDIAPAATPQVLAEEPGPGVFFPAAWSADGQAVLAQRGPAGRGDRATRLLRVPTDGGPVDEVAVFSEERNVSDLVAVSPDRSRVAFSAKPEPGASDKYIYVLDLSTGKEFAVVRVAGADGAVWSADGQRLFYRTYNGRFDLWSIDVAAEGAVSEPVRLHSGLPPSVSLAVTASGDLLFGRSEGARQSVVIRSRSVGVQPESAFGPGSLPAISPDGRSVAFRRGQAGLIVRDLESGAERAYPKDLYGIPPVWSPDNRTLVGYAHPAADNDSPSGAFYRLDVASSAYTRLFARDADGWVRNASVAVSRDQRALVTLARPESHPGGWTALVEIDLATGVQRELMTFDEPIRGAPVPPALSISPDGASLAILVLEPLQGQLAANLFVASLDAPALRHVTGPFAISRYASSPAWTADSGSILVGALNEQGAFQVMRVSVGGGPLAPDGPSLAEVPHPRVAPSDGGGVSVSLDGSRLAFSVNQRGGFELWSLDVRRR